MSENEEKEKAVSDESVTEPATEGKLVFKDFLPKETSSGCCCCCRGEWNTFSEIVQEANDWLRTQENVKIISCETVSFNSNPDVLLIHDSWPYTFYLRGLRIWLEYIEPGKITSASSHINGPKGGRLLLGYRDFLPKLDGKSVFSGQYENAQQILMRINSYIATKGAPTKFVSLETLDSPTAGVVEIDADTDMTGISYSQHGYTRFVRFLRLFFLTRYPKPPRPQTAIAFPFLDVKDFVPRKGEEESISSLIGKALLWCSQRDDVGFLNLQVLSVKAGSVDSGTSTWVMDCPGHLPNKFTTFVRVAFMSSNVITCGVTTIVVPTSEIETTTTTTINPYSIKMDTPVKRPQFDEDPAENENNTPNEELDDIDDNGSTNTIEVHLSDENLVKEIIDVENAAEETTSNIINVQPSPDQKNLEGDKNKLDDPKSLEEDEEDVHPIIQDYEDIKTRGFIAKSFFPEATVHGRICRRNPEWETMEVMRRKMNEWVSLLEGKTLQVHTQHIFFKGSSPDTDKPAWIKYFPGGSWMPILHVIVDPEENF